MSRPADMGMFIFSWHETAEKKAGSNTSKAFAEWQKKDKNKIRPLSVKNLCRTKFLITFSFPQNYNKTFKSAAKKRKT